MRISYWSSDVCSSDLVRSTLAEVRAAVADWPRMQQALRNDLDTIHDTEGAALLRWFLDRRLTQLGHELRDRGGEAGAQIGICAVRGEPLLSSHSIRSEEHTSELQSLMSISYAVFCLNNKKK